MRTRVEQGNVDVVECPEEGCRALIPREVCERYLPAAVIQQYARPPAPPSCGGQAAPDPRPACCPQADAVRAPELRAGSPQD